MVCLEWSVLRIHDASLNYRKYVSLHSLSRNVRAGRVPAARCYLVSEAAEVAEARGAEEAEAPTKPWDRAGA